MKRIILCIFIFLNVLLFCAEENFIIENEQITKIVIEDIQIRNNIQVPGDIIKNAMKIKTGKTYIYETTKDEKNEKSESNAFARDMVNDYITINNMEYFEEINLYPELSNKKIRLIVEVKEKINVFELLKKDNIVPETEMDKIDKSQIVYEIQCVGNSFIKSDDILSKLPFKVGSYLTKETLKEGKENIDKMGWFRLVEFDTVKNNANNKLIVKYIVLENPVIREIVIDGNKLIKTEELLKIMETKLGEIYNKNTFIKDCDRIKARYSSNDPEKDYALTSVINATGKDNTLFIKISEGVVRGVVFRKESKNIDNRNKDEEENEENKELKTKAFVFERENVIQKGEVFRTATATKTMQNIYRLGFIKSISFQNKKIPEDEDGYSIIVNIDEKKSGTYDGGITYSFQNRGSLSATLKIQDINFLGNAQTVGASFEVSNNKEFYELKFLDPWINGTAKWSLGSSIFRNVGVTAQQTDVVDGSRSIVYDTSSNNTGFKISLGKEILKNTTFNVEYKIEHDIVRYHKTTTDSAIEHDNDDYVLNSVEPSIIFDSRDNYLNPFSGDYGKLSCILGKYGDKEQAYYLTSELDLRKYHSFILPRNIFAYRFGIGYGSEFVRVTQKFPINNKKIRSVMTEYRSKYELFFNFEDRYEFFPKVQAAVFFDTGRGWDDWDTLLKLENMQSACGMGIRWDSPFGIWRVDFAIATDKSLKDLRKDLIIDIDFGQMF